MNATRLDIAPVDRRIARLEARQKELYALLGELRSAAAPRERIRELILEIDEHDALVEAAHALPPAPPVSPPEPVPPALRFAPPPRPRAPEPAPPPDPVEDEPGVPLVRILIVGAVIVAAAAVLGVLVAGRGSGSPGAGTSVAVRTVPLAVPPASPAPAAASVPVRLLTHLSTTPCSGSDAHTALRWTWTLPTGYDGQAATIEATGPGLAGSFRRIVAGSRVGLTYTSSCLASGATWSVSLESVGATPARLTGVAQAP